MNIGIWFIFKTNGNYERKYDLKLIFFAPHGAGVNEENQ